LRLMSNNRTVVLAFCCKEIYQLIQKDGIRAIAVPNEALTEIHVSPAVSKTKLYPDGRYGVCLAVTKQIPRSTITPANRTLKVKVTLDLNEFGLPLESFIDDADGKLLFEILKTKDFQLYPARSTSNNQMGDLLVLKNGLLYSLHITRFNPTVNRLDNRLRLRHYILGKIAFQTFNAKTKKALKCVVILHSALLSKRVVTEKVLDFFDSLDLIVLFTDFSPNWKFKISEKLVTVLTPKN
jgi:hypothetical protein